MPTLRLMADGRPIYATAGARDLDGVPSFAVGEGEVVLAAVDFTAWLGAATLSAVTWIASGGTVGTTTTTGGLATALVTMPSASVEFGPGPMVGASVAAVASDGRTLNRRLRLYATCQTA